MNPIDSAVNLYKEGINVAALVNEASVAALTYTSLQSKCMFEIIIYPQKFPTTKGNIALAAMESLVMRTYLYSIDDFVLNGFEYQRTGGIQWVKDLIYPESITFNFLETGLGVVKTYLKKWMEEIAVLTPMQIGQYETKDYIFNSDQNAAKRIAIIIPLQTDLIPANEWIYIEGLKFKNVTGMGYDHANGDNEILAVEFSCDNVHLKGQVA